MTYEVHELHEWQRGYRCNMIGCGKPEEVGVHDEARSLCFPFCREHADEFVKAQSENEA